MCQLNHEANISEIPGLEDMRLAVSPLSLSVRHHFNAEFLSPVSPCHPFLPLFSTPLFLVHDMLRGDTHVS